MEITSCSSEKVRPHRGLTARALMYGPNSTTGRPGKENLYAALIFIIVQAFTAAMHMYSRKR